MTGVELLAMFLNALVACSAMPMYETRISGQDYQIQSWRCQAESGPVVVKTWRAACPSGNVKYWGHMFYMYVEGVNMGVLNTRYGETHIGQGAQITDAYPPACGS